MAGSAPGWLLAVAGSPYPYVTVGCSAIGMLIFQTGLQRCRVSIVGPVSNITGSVFFIVAGTWLFGERLPADPAKLALRLAGIVGGRGGRGRAVQEAGQIRSRGTSRSPAPSRPTGRRAPMVGAA